ncbi:MAG: carboxylating nicotinate-nucleotide diphosphorylase [Gloeocapsa sp. DLM2.Bin57]|nr:MAG: carboxylating nicotinate-nucleotide diphosphorylase [Gloeocapsa sp. DLM2.Bin57]
MMFTLPWIIIDPLLNNWLLEDIGRGDRTTAGLLAQSSPKKATWIAKQQGVIAGLPVAGRVFNLINPQVNFSALVTEGTLVTPGETIATLDGPLDALLMGERVALNLAMRLSGISTLTREYVAKIEDLPTQLVDTRKTTPGLRILEKYAIQVGGGRNHRLGLDDAIMIKDNHIAGSGGIEQAISQIRQTMPYPLTIEVETSNLAQVTEAIALGADIIMLDNMTIPDMVSAVKLIKSQNPHIKIEASGNITLDNIRAVAKTRVDYISTSAPITRSSWLDLSMRII